MDILLQMPNAPTGWESWDSRTVVVFIAVTAVGAMISLIWWLLNESRNARESFLTALEAIRTQFSETQNQFKETEKNGHDRHRLLRASLKRIRESDEQHARTLQAVHQLLEVLAKKMATNHEHDSRKDG